MLDGVDFDVRAGEVLGHRRAARLGPHRDPRDAVRRERRAERRRGPARRTCRSRSRSPRDARRLGIALVTEDRKAKGLHLDASIRDNVALPSLGADRPLRRPLGAGEARVAADAVRRLGVRCTGIEQVAATLSGGNQQKVVIGKWLATRPARAAARRADPRHRRRRQAGDLRADPRARRRGAGDRDGELGAARAPAARRPDPGDVGGPADRRCWRAPRRARRRSCTSPRRAAPRRERWRRDCCGPVAHQALLGAGGDLPDRRADLAGELEGQQHLSLLRQPARRAAAGLDHRPDRHRHDGGDPDRRHRPLGRLDHGALLGGLRHAADRAGLDPGGGDGGAGAGADRLRRARRRDPLRLPQRRAAAPPAARRGAARPAARDGAADRARARRRRGRRSGSCCRRSRPSSACSGCCWSRRASG